MLALSKDEGRSQAINSPMPYKYQGQRAPSLRLLDNILTNSPIKKVSSCLTARDSVSVLDKKKIEYIQKTAVDRNKTSVSGECFTQTYDESEGPTNKEKQEFQEATNVIPFAEDVNLQQDNRKNKIVENIVEKQMLRLDKCKVEISPHTEGIAEYQEAQISDRNIASELEKSAPLSQTQKSGLERYLNPTKKIERRSTESKLNETCKVHNASTLKINNVSIKQPSIRYIDLS